MKLVTPVQILFISNQKTHRSCYIFIFKYLLTNKIFIPNKNNYFWLIENNKKKLLVFLWKKSEYFRSERKNKWYYHIIDIYIIYILILINEKKLIWLARVCYIIAGTFHLISLHSKISVHFSISEFTLLSKIHVNLISSIRSFIS